jgi:hypothetical protein
MASSKSILRRWIEWLALAGLVLAVLVLNPWFGVTGYSYGASEMRAAIEGTWRLTITSDDAAPIERTFTLAQAASDPSEVVPAETPSAPHASRGWIRRAAACGTRSLVRSASACMDITRMPLDVKIAGGDEVVHAEFVVGGTTFNRGGLVLEIADYWLDAGIAPDGEVAHADVADREHHARKLTATLVRIGRPATRDP